MAPVRCFPSNSFLQISLNRNATHSAALQVLAGEPGLEDKSCKMVRTLPLAILYSQVGLGSLTNTAGVQQAQRHSEPVSRERRQPSQKEGQDYQGQRLER